MSDSRAASATTSAHTGQAGVLYLPDHRAVEGFLPPLPVDALHGLGPDQAESPRRWSPTRLRR
ncbi:hypothetical protein ACFVU3_13515 [Streptomyces sp. NPDC058052]|uniref:hypothetical protein n=1 Tax=Streptomyces sp. NPDC058052 TaxID=3346316 RepID=UPI0036E4C3C9